VVLLGGEQLVGHFFQELGLQLAESDDARLTEIGGRMKRYGRLLAPARLIPVAGPWLKRFAKLGEAVGDALTTEPEPASLRRQYGELRDELAETNRRIVVMVDDIDRLEDDGFER